MTLERSFIPYGGYWSSPFCRWQGSIGHVNSIKLAAETARRFLEAREISPETFDGTAVGFTIPQKGGFYGAPWLAGMIGAPGITGAMYAQACATSARVIAAGAGEVETGMSECVLGVTFDRTSNGPHIVYPAPAAPGGTVDAENWVMTTSTRTPSLRTR